MKINKINLIDGTDIGFGSINVIIGPNNVGKTVLMREILLAPLNTHFLGGKWLSNKNIDSLEFISNDFDDIEKHLVFDNGTQRIVKYQRNFEGNIVDLQTDELTQELSECINKKKFSDNREYYDHYRRIVANFYANEPTNNRLNIVGTTGISKRTSPKDIYNYLLNNPNLVEELDSLLFDLFKLKLIIDVSERAEMEIFVTKDNPFEKVVVDYNDDLELLKKCKKEKFTLLDRCGDGIKAVVRLFLSVYDPLSKILFIDEPEVFLNKRIRKRVAQRFTEAVSKNSKQLFLVTHDPVFLSGFINSPYSSNEIKVYYIKDFNSINLVNLGDRTITRATKQEKYLDMFFHDYSIVCEGPDDVYFYSEAIRKKTEEDIFYTSIDGASKVNQISKLIKLNNLQVRIIFDFDCLFKKENGNLLVNNLYKEFTGEDIKDIANIQQLLDSSIVSPNKKYKRGIRSETWYIENKNWIEKIINDLSNNNIYIVSDGALESWFSDENGEIYEEIDKVARNNDFNNFIITIIQSLNNMEPEGNPL